MKANPQDLFVRALELEGEERQAFLADACGDDAELRLEVERLLVDAKRADALFGLTEDGITVIEGDSAGDVGAGESEGDRVGPYTLRQRIGEGGFGVVWMAEQHEPIARMVALKVVKAGMDTRQVLARFEAERQALAMMDHPNIARVLDAGATESGRPYFAMELVRGVPLVDFCDDQKLTTEARLELFRDVCSAVNHAHQKGIIHRDLKPSNVMVTLHGDKPVPKVIDFGIAKATQSKLTDKTLFTRFEQFLGTPVYMSPEQAAMSGLDIDTRSDIYSLGVLLYELLAGRPPFDSQTLVSAGYDEMRRIIREEDPPRPSLRVSTVEGKEGTRITTTHGAEPQKLERLLRGDLDWIVMKAIEKDRTRRYETANALSADLGRYLVDEPVLATPPSASYKLRKFTRRNKAAMVTAAAVAVILLVATGVSGWLAVRAREAEKHSSKLAEEKTQLAEEKTEFALQAEKNAELATRNAEEAEAARKKEESMRATAEAEAEKRRREVYCSDMFMAGHAITEEDSFILASHVMEKWMPKRGEEDLREWEWYYLDGLHHREDLSLVHGTDAIDVCWSPDGKYILAGGSLSRNHGVQTHLSLWNAETGQPLTLPNAGSLDLRTGSPNWTRANAVAWSPDGRHFVGGCHLSRVQVFEAASGEPVGSLPQFAKGCSDLEWTPDGKQLVVSSHGRLKVVDPFSGKILRKSGGYAAALSPDGTRYATNINDSIIIESLVADGDSRVLVRADPEHNSKRLHLEKIPGAWSPDGRTLAWALQRHSIMLYDTASGEPISELAGHSHSLDCLAWSPDGRFLLSSGADSTVRIWDGRTYLPRATLAGHHDTVISAAWSPDGRKIVSASYDGEVRVWDVQKALESGVQRMEIERFGDLRCSPREDLFATSGHDGTIRIRRFGDPDPIALLKGHTGEISDLIWSPDGTRLASAGSDNRVRIWEAGTWQEVGVFRSPVDRVRGIDWSADGRRLLAANLHGVWDAKRGEEIFRTEQFWTDGKPKLLNFVLSNADESELLMGGLWMPSVVLDGASGKTLRLTRNRNRTNTRARASRDRSRFGVTSNRVVAAVLDESFEPVFHLVGHPISANVISFSPDGRRAATGGGSGDVRVWDLETGLQVLRIEAHEEAVCGIDWSHDGMRIISGAIDGTVIMHDAAPGYRRQRSSSGLPVLAGHVGRGDQPGGGNESRLGRAEEALAELREAYQIQSRKIQSSAEPELAASEWIEFLLQPRPVLGDRMIGRKPVTGEMVGKVVADRMRLGKLEFDEARSELRSLMQKQRLADLEKEIQSDPTSVELRLRRSLMLGCQGETGASRAGHEEVVRDISRELDTRREALGPGHPATATASDWLAYAKILAGDLSGARKDLHREQDRSTWKRLVREGWLMGKAPGSADGALEAFVEARQKTIGSSRPDLGAIRDLAVQMAWLERTEEHHELCRALFARSESFEGASDFEGAARSLLVHSKPDPKLLAEASAFADRALALKADHQQIGRSRLVAGLAACRNGGHKEALSHFEVCLQSSSHLVRAPALFYAGISKLHEGDWAGARRDFLDGERVVPPPPFRSLLTPEIGKVDELVLWSSYDEAIQTCDSYLRNGKLDESGIDIAGNRTKEADIWRHQGTFFHRLFRQVHRLDELVQAKRGGISSVTALRIDDDQMYFEAGRMSADKGEVAAALRAFEAAGERVPEDPEARANFWRRVGGQLNTLREWEAAVTAYGRVLEWTPEDFEARLARAVLILERLKRYREAIPDLDALVAQAPDDAHVHRHRGYCYSRLKDWEKCRTAWDEAVRLAAEEDRALMAIARARSYWLPRGEWEEASADLALVTDTLRGGTWWMRRDGALHGLLTGNAEAHERHLSKFKPTIDDNPSEVQARWLVILHVLSSGMVTENNRPRLLELASGLNKAWPARLSAAIEMRSGRYRPKADPADPWEQLIGALAFHHAGDKERARRLFRMSEKWMSGHFNKGANHHVPVVDDWAVWASQLILFREAEALITGKPGSFEARMFARLEPAGGNASPRQEGELQAGAEGESLDRGVDQSPE